MESIKVSELSDELPFGARVKGVSLKNVHDNEVRQQIHEIFEDRGVILFEEVESSNELQLAISSIFGPPQDHALKAMPVVDKKMQGVANLDYKGNLVEIDGKQIYGWVGWHIDACYTAKLNRGGVLRAIEVPPEGGFTGFADGIQLYNAVSQEFRDAFAHQDILYHPKLMFTYLKFGKPKGYRVISLPESVEVMLKQAETAKRSIQPAIWQRKTGEHVLHVSPWQAAGLYGRENPEGEALLEALCQEIYAKMKPYWHKWKPTDMVAWDNWRLLHAVSGNDPKYPRRMQRTTIEGDYGLGRFEDGTREDASSSSRFDV